MAHVPIDKNDYTPNHKKIHKPNNCIKINKAINIVDDQVYVAHMSVTTSSSIFQKNCKFTRLSKSLQSIMTMLLSAKIMILPPVKPLFLSTTSSLHFNPWSFCQFHHQLGHDAKSYYSLRHNI